MPDETPGAPVNPETPPAQEPEAPQAAPSQVKDERMWAMLAHLSGIFFSFIGPLVIWLIQKDKMPFVDDQGKEALNFQITVAIAWVAAGILAGITFGIGALLFPALGIADLVFCIMAGMKANEGVEYRYPINIRFIK